MRTLSVAREEQIIDAERGLETAIGKVLPGVVLVWKWW